MEIQTDPLMCAIEPPDVWHLIDIIRVDERAPRPAEIDRNKLHLNFAERGIGATGRPQKPSKCRAAYVRDMSEEKNKSIDRDPFEASINALNK